MGYCGEALKQHIHRTHNANIDNMHHHHANTGPHLQLEMLRQSFD